MAFKINPLENIHPGKVDVLSEQRIPILLPCPVLGIYFRSSKLESLDPGNIIYYKL